VWIDFKINQEYIAANLCIEKDIEESTCKGSCHLKKELDKVETNKGKQEDAPFQFTETHINNLFIGEIEEFGVCLCTTDIQITFSQSILILQKGYPSTIFHPPIS
jgi:hypothetical protein